jgi:O-antigen ligase
MDPRANRRILVATTFVGACGLALLLSALALQSTTLATGACLGIVGFVVLFVEPFVGLFNYLIFLYIRPQDFLPGFVGMPIMLMLGAATAALVVLNKAVVKRSLTLAHAPQNLLLLWFYAAIVLSQLATLNLGAALGASLEFVSVLTMYFLITNLVSTLRRFRSMMHLLVFLTLSLAAQGIVQHLTGAGLGGQQSYKGRIQAIGIFSDPNDLALAINTVLPLTLMVMLESPRVRSRIVAAVLNLVFIYSVVLTQSRGGLLSFGVLMIILFARRYGRMFGLIGGGMIMLALVALGPRMSSISTDEASAYGRVEAWALGLDLFQAYPLFGVGFGNFLEYHFRTAHNSFVLCATELGMFGLYPWVMMIYLSIKTNRFISEQYRERGDRRSAMYAEALEYALVTFVLGAYFLSRTYHELLFVLVGLSAALVHLFVSAEKDRYVLIEKRDFVYGLGWLVAGWAVTKLFLFTAW